MNILQIKYRFIFLLCFLTAGTKSFCQDALINAKVDKNEILIGEQVKLKVTVSFPAGKFTSGLTDLPDVMEHFEVVNKSKQEEEITNDKFSGFTQDFILTSFDSGKWVIPPVKVNLILPGSNTPAAFYTDSFPVNVSYSLSDTTSQLKDIKPVRGVEIKFPVWYWIAAGVILVALIVFIIWFYRHWKKNKSKPVNVVFKSKLSPYDEAVQELENLKKTNPVTQQEIKVFYTKLTDVLKRYLSRRDNVLYFNATSGDLLILLSQRGVNRDMVSKAASGLRLADAVKFAKYTASADECVESLQSVRQTISVTEELMLTSKQ